MKQKKDIFDRIMHLPGLRIFEPFYVKYKEVLLYIFFGGLAFFLNLFLFIGIDKLLKINDLINNVICWIVCVSFQYITNRTWVFDGHVESAEGLGKQIVSFFGGRIFTLIVEELILLIFITWLSFPSVYVKLAAQVVIIILNYVISKMIVFKN